MKVDCTRPLDAKASVTITCTVEEARTLRNSLEMMNLADEPLEKRTVLLAELDKALQPPTGIYY